MYFNKEWEKFNGVETDYIKLYYYEFDSGYSDIYNSYSYYRLCTILDGKKKVRVDEGDDFTYDRSQYVLLSPRSKVHMTMPEKTKALVLELSDSLIEDVSNKLSLEHSSDVEIGSVDYHVSTITNHMSKSLSNINQIFSGEGNDKEKSFFIDLAVQKMTYGLLNDKQSGKFLSMSNGNPMHMAIEKFKEGYNKGVTIAEVAFMLNMSPSNFTNKFKQVYDITPKQYLDCLKMNKAMEMLKVKTVSEVAYELGFINVSNFITKFKRKHGHTPKQYQLEHISKCKIM